MHKQRGQTVVEFAFIVPVFVVVILGVIGLGRVFYAYIDVANAARAGARYLSTDTTLCPGGTNAATFAGKVAAAEPNLDWAPKTLPQPTITPDCTSVAGAVSTQVTLSFDTLTYFLGTNGVISMSSSATMPTLS